MTKDSASNVSKLQAPDLATNTHKVFIHDLLINMFIGIYEHEKTTRQRVRFNIDMVVENPVDPLDDDYHNVVCYQTITEAIQTHTEKEHINLVETLVEQVADICMSNKRVVKVVVKVEKLDAIKNTGSVGVEIERART